MPPVIVYGADGSDESLAAAEVAGRLAKQLRGRLVVGQALKRRSHEAGEEATHLFERVAERAREAEIDRRLVHGQPAEALAGLAEDEDALLSVVGSPGVAAAVVASELASALGGELVLLHVYEPFPAAAMPAAPGVPPADHERLKQRQRRAGSPCSKRPRTASARATRLRIDGGPGADRIRTRGGADEASGGLGRDAISTGGGDDVIDARDGERDVVDCGKGRDTVYADSDDTLRRCERVMP